LLAGNSISWKWKLSSIVISIVFLWYFGYKANRGENTGFLSYIPGITVEPVYVRSKPFVRAIAPLLIITILSGCLATENSGSTPWSALGLGAAASTAPAIGGSVTGSATGQGQYSTPGQGNATNSGTVIASGAGQPIAGMVFFHPDPGGSPIVLTSTNGEAIVGSNGASRIYYNPYGDIDTDYSGGPDIFHKKYQGQDLDSESGMYYFKSRYYDVALGRFITSDDRVNPSSPMGMDRYMFTEGNPIRYNDPTGHSKEKKWMTNMKKDFFKATYQNFMKNSTPEEKIIASLIAHKYNKDQRKKEKRAEMPRTITTVVVIAAAIVVTLAFNWAGAAIAFEMGLSNLASFGFQIIWGGITGELAGNTINEIGGATMKSFGGSYREGSAIGESIGGVVSTVTDFFTTYDGVEKKVGDDLEKFLKIKTGKIVIMQDIISNGERMTPAQQLASQPTRIKNSIEPGKVDFIPKLRPINNPGIYDPNNGWDDINAIGWNILQHYSAGSLGNRIYNGYF
ncbi:MAG: RHS repeat-associated core domain-containing protein, partial [Leptospiraceae bacterium]|nr:RHS repeat-associated core domain-containing protein [Leptospiraceae bacterium]